MVKILKNNKKIVNHRRNKILLEVQTNTEVLVNDLSNKLNVSPLTIRRDLIVLEENGFIERFYGGARFKNMEDSQLNNVSSDSVIKSIAKFATRYIEDNDTIFMNSSNTVLCMIPFIKNKNVTIVTNNGSALFLDNNPNVSIFITGGELNMTKRSLTGEFALRNLKKVSATKSFLGCSGINVHGITTVVPQEVTINEYMLDKCPGNIFILADKSKIGREYSFLSGSIKKINTLITDSPISDEIILMEKQGVNVVSIYDYEGV